MQATSSYSHIVMLIDLDTDQITLRKAHALASCYGARLSLMYILPVFPKVKSGVIDPRHEYKQIASNALVNLCQSHHIPPQDLIIFDSDENGLSEFLARKGIDLILVDMRLCQMEPAYCLARWQHPLLHCDLYLLSQDVPHASCD